MISPRAQQGWDGTCVTALTVVILPVGGRIRVSFDPVSFLLTPSFQLPSLGFLTRLRDPRQLLPSMEWSRE